MGFLDSFRSSRLNHWLQRILRVLQFLSPVISLGLFSSRLAKIARLSQRITKSNGAVEGILAAAVIYTLMVMFLTFFIKHGGPRIMRWLLMLMDLLYVANQKLSLRGRVPILTSSQLHGRLHRRCIPHAAAWWNQWTVPQREPL